MKFLVLQRPAFPAHLNSCRFHFWLSRISFTVKYICLSCCFLRLKPSWKSQDYQGAFTLRANAKSARLCDSPFSSRELVMSSTTAQPSHPAEGMLQRATALDTAGAEASKDARSVLAWSLRVAHCSHVLVTTSPLFQQQMKSWKVLWLYLSVIHNTQALKPKISWRYPDRSVTGGALAGPRGAGTVSWGCCWRKEKIMNPPSAALRFGTVW